MKVAINEVRSPLVYVKFSPDHQVVGPFPGEVHKSEERYRYWNKDVNAPFANDFLAHNILSMKTADVRGSGHFSRAPIAITV